MTDIHVNPGQSISNAIASANPGDNILIHAGTYVERVLIQNVQGTDTAWITIQPAGDGAVIIDGQPSGSYDGVFYIRGTSTTRCHYIHITGLEIRNSGYAGIFVYGDTYADVTNIHIDYCEIHDCCSSGIYAYHASNVEFDHNNVHYVNHTITVEGAAQPSQEGISFSGVYGFEIHHNYLGDCGKEGIDTKSGSRNGSVHHNEISVTQENSFVYDHIGIYCDAYTLENFDIDIYNNYIHGDHGQGLIVGAEKDNGNIHHINVFNNIIDVSWASAPGLGLTTYHLNGVTPLNRHVHDIYFYNNTVRTSSHHPMYINVDQPFLEGNVVWENNIFYTQTSSYNLYNRHYPSTTPQTILLLRNNLFYRVTGAANNQWSNGTGLYWGEASIVDQNPSFTGGTGSDYFHLQSNSPAINNGTPVDLDFDYDGLLRPYPVGGNFDIGAYEYGSISEDVDDTVEFTVTVV